MLTRDIKIFNSRSSLSRQLDKIFHDFQSRKSQKNSENLVRSSRGDLIKIFKANNIIIVIPAHLYGNVDVHRGVGGPETHSEYAHMKINTKFLLMRLKK